MEDVKGTKFIVVTEIQSRDFFALAVSRITQVSNRNGCACIRFAISPFDVMEIGVVETFHDIVAKLGTV